MRFAASLITAGFIAAGLFGAAAAQTVHSGWKKVCANNQQTGLKRVCNTRAETWNKGDNSLLAAAVIIEAEGEPGNILRVNVPLGMQLKHGTRLIVSGNTPLLARYTLCIMAGCQADYEATPALLDGMRTGGLTVQAIGAKGKPLSVNIPLADFAAAYDGPAAKPDGDEIELPRKEIAKLPKSWRTTP